MTAGHESPWPRLVWGAALLTAGVIFWLDRLGRIDAGDYFHWWPLALIAAGLAQIPQRNWAAATIWLVIGTFFLLPRLGIPKLALWRVIGLWPLIFSVGGAFLIFQAWSRREKERRGTIFRTAAVMGADVRVVRSNGLAGGDAVAVMGGCEIDLTAARPLPEVVVDVLAFWGGVEIQIPPGWHVVGHVAEILGGFDNKTVPAIDGAPRLIVRGAAIMGGVMVSSSSAEVA